MASKGTLIVDDGPIPLTQCEWDTLMAAAGSCNLDAKRGTIIACATCGYFECICEIRQTHKPDCKFRRAMETSVSIECEHGLDVCPQCDPCDC